MSTQGSTFPSQAPFQSGASPPPASPIFTQSLPLPSVRQRPSQEAGVRAYRFVVASPCTLLFSLPALCFLLLPCSLSPNTHLFLISSHHLLCVLRFPHMCPCGCPLSSICVGGGTTCSSEVLAHSELFSSISEQAGTSCSSTGQFTTSSHTGQPCSPCYRTPSLMPNISCQFRQKGQDRLPSRYGLMQIRRSPQCALKC